MYELPFSDLSSFDVMDEINLCNLNMNAKVDDGKKPQFLFLLQCPQDHGERKKKTEKQNGERTLCLYVFGLQTKPRSLADKV